MKKYKLQTSHLLIILLILLLFIIYTTSNTCDNFVISSAPVDPRNSVTYDPTVKDQLECKILNKFPKSNNKILFQTLKEDPSCKGEDCSLGQGYRILDKVSGHTNTPLYDDPKDPKSPNTYIGTWDDFENMAPYRKKEFAENQATGFNLTTLESMYYGNIDDVKIRCGRFLADGDRRSIGGGFIDMDKATQRAGKLYEILQNISEVANFHFPNETELLEEGLSFKETLMAIVNHQDEIFDILDMFNKMFCDKDGVEIVNIYKGNRTPSSWIIEEAKCNEAVKSAEALGGPLQSKGLSKECKDALKERGKYEAIRLIFSAMKFNKKMRRVLQMDTCINVIGLAVTAPGMPAWMKIMYDELNKQTQKITDGIDAVIQRVGSDLRPIKVTGDGNEMVPLVTEGDHRGMNDARIRNMWNDSCDVQVRTNDGTSKFPCKSWTGEVCGTETYKHYIRDRQGNVVHRPGDKKPVDGCLEYYINPSTIVDEIKSWRNDNPHLLVKIKEKQKRILEGKIREAEELLISINVQQELGNAHSELLNQLEEKIKEAEYMRSKIDDLESRGVIIDDPEGGDDSPPAGR